MVLTNLKNVGEYVFCWNLPKKGGQRRRCQCVLSTAQEGSGLGNSTAFCLARQVGISPHGIFYFTECVCLWLRGRLALDLPSTTLSGSMSFLLQNAFQTHSPAEKNTQIIQETKYLSLLGSNYISLQINTLHWQSALCINIIQDFFPFSISVVQIISK